jgi:hypothetical protein
MGTEVELILLSLGPGGLRFRSVSAPLDRGTHPDTVARALSGLGPDDGAALIHSTSWRFCGGRIILTYAALPDPAPYGAHPVPLWPAAGSGQALAPSPGDLEPADVAVHACRHLAYLHRTDPLVAHCAAAAPALWTTLDTYAPAVAGRPLSPLRTVPT